MPARSSCAVILRDRRTLAVGRSQTRSSPLRVPSGNEGKKVRKIEWKQGKQVADSQRKKRKRRKKRDTKRLTCNSLVRRRQQLCALQIGVENHKDRMDGLMRAARSVEIENHVVSLPVDRMSVATNHELIVRSDVQESNAGVW